MKYDLLNMQEAYRDMKVYLKFNEKMFVGVFMLLIVTAMLICVYILCAS